MSQHRKEYILESEQARISGRQIFRREKQVAKLQRKKFLDYIIYQPYYNPDVINFFSLYLV